MTPEDLQKAYDALKIESQGSFSFTQSHSALEIPSDHFLIVGDDARKFDMLAGNLPNSAVEAVLLSPNDNGEVYFESYRNGYVPLDDWDKVDAKAMLQEMSESTEHHNKERVKKGLSEMHVVGWCKEPTLDRKSHTVYWALETQRWKS